MLSDDQLIEIMEFAIVIEEKNAGAIHIQTVIDSFNAMVDAIEAKMGISE